jgi:hypothetical protein
MTISERYSDGSNYTGPIAIADLDLQGFRVNNQYFTYATESRNGTATALGLDGILGLVKNTYVYWIYLILSNRVLVRSRRSILLSRQLQNPIISDFLSSIIFSARINRSRTRLPFRSVVSHILT